MVYMGDKVNKQVRYFQINIIGTLSRWGPGGWQHGEDDSVCRRPVLCCFLEVRDKEVNAKWCGG